MRMSQFDSGTKKDDDVSAWQLPFIHESFINGHYCHMVTSLGVTIHFSIIVTSMPSTKPTAKAITIAFMLADLCFFISQICRRANSISALIWDSCCFISPTYCCHFPNLLLQVYLIYIEFLVVQVLLILPFGPDVATSCWVFLHSIGDMNHSNLRAKAQKSEAK